jgi:LuxR family maltose regulon positive regulatory protein
MLEPPADPPAGAGVGGSDRLLATKLFAPSAQPGFVSRPRLVEALDVGLGRGLVLISAPAGFGKTALLAEWSSQRPVAWLSLDPGDSDPARFWRYALAALDRARPGIADGVGPLLGPPAPPSYEGLVTALVNELVGETDEPGEHGEPDGSDGGEVVLVLDDYHVIDSQEIHATLAWLLERRPPGLHLVLTSRADPPLPLARLRARGQLAELRAADLRFTEEEAAALLQEVVDIPVPEASVAALADRTEGWAAGLRLAALALGGRSDVAEFVRSFSGSHRYVLDYLAEEVLERQTEAVRAFLLETSVLERLSADLCDAVTGRSDGGAMLETIDRSNLFLVPLDEVRGWWRYHQLFADLLRARLQQHQPERVQQLHRNAARWYERGGLANDAITHAMAAGDGEWAARMMERQVDALLVRSEGVTLQRWLTALPAGLVDTRPRLLLAQADVALGSGQVKAGPSPMSPTSRRWEGRPAWWRTSPPPSRSGAPISPTSGATPPGRSPSITRRSPSSGTVRPSWRPRCGSTCTRSSCCAGISRRPNRPSSPASRSCARQARPTWSCGPASSSGISSAPGVAWTPLPGRTAKG